MIRKKKHQAHCKTWCLTARVIKLNLRVLSFKMTGFWGSYALGHLIAIHTIVLNEKLQGKETSKRDLEQRPARHSK